MGKKKKGTVAAAQLRLLEQWADKCSENEAAFQEKVKATAKRQLSRKQQRRKAAAGGAWGDSSPERGPTGDGSGDERQVPASAPPRTSGGLRLPLGSGNRASGSDSEEEDEQQEEQEEQQVRGALAEWSASVFLWLSWQPSLLHNQQPGTHAYTSATSSSNRPH